MNSCQAQLETATENDIPVIIFDSNVSENELVTGFYGTDNERVGEIAGEKMAEALGEKGSILIFLLRKRQKAARSVSVDLKLPLQNIQIWKLYRKSMQIR